MSSPIWNTSNHLSSSYAAALQELGAEALSPEFLDEYLPQDSSEVKEELEECEGSMDRQPNGNGGGGGGGEMGEGQTNQQQGIYYSSGQERFDRYNQQTMPSSASLMQPYTPEQQQQMARTPEMHNGSPVVQQLTPEQHQALSAQRQAMLQRQYSSPSLTGRSPINGSDQRSKSSQNLMGNVQLQQQQPQQQRPQEGAMNGQMALSQTSGFISPTYQSSTAQMRPQSAQQLAQMQQLQQQQQYQQQLQQQGSNQQMSMSMQINSQMTQMNIQVGNQSGMQQQNQQLQHQQYTQQQLQHMQQQQQPQIHTAQPAQTLQQLQQQGQLNGQYASFQMGPGCSTMVQPQQMQMSEQQLQLEQQARLIRARQHPHLSTQPRSASMGSLPLGQQPPQYSYPYGQHPGQGQRPNGLNAYTANGTPVPSNWQMAYQTEMPPAFLNYYHPGKAHPYFDHARRNLHYPYPLGIKEIGDRPGEPGTFGFLPDSIYYDPANDRRNAKDGNMPGPSTSKASPKKRGAGAAGGAAGGAKKQRRTNSVDQADDARFVQPYPPNMTAAQQQRMASTSSTMFPAASGASYDGFSQPGMSIQQQQAMMQQSQPHIQLQRQMSAPAYSGLSQSHAEAMQSARQQQAIANAQAQYSQQQVPSASGQMTHDGYQQSTNGDGMYSEMQWRAQQQPTTPTGSSSSQPVFRSPQPTQPAFNNGTQPQQGQQSNEQMYWNQQQ